MQLSRSNRLSNKRSAKKRVNLVVICIVAFTLQTSCTLDSKTNIQKNAERTVSAQLGNTSGYYTVEKGTATTVLIGTGKIVPTKTTSLYFNNVSGPLDVLNFGLNDLVKKDDLFAEIRPTDIENRIETQKIVVEKSKARLKQLDASPLDIKRVEKSIQSLQLELDEVLEQQKELPKNNELSLEKAQLAMDQLKIQMKSLVLSEDLAKLDGQQDVEALTKLKIRLEQIDNDIASAQAAVAEHQKNYNDMTKNEEVTDAELSLAKLQLDQLILSLENSMKSKQLAELDLSIATAVTSTEAGHTSEEGSTKADLRITQAQLALEGIQKSMDVAALTIEQTSISNEEKVETIENEITQIKLQLEQLQLQLASQIKNHEYEKLQAGYDLQLAELNLGALEESLTNGKLYSPVDGVVSQLSNFSITDIIGSGQLLAKIADPDKLVFQLAAADAKYITEANRAVLTIGTEKYDVELYKPQPGDSFLQSNMTSTDNTGNVYVKFMGETPQLKFDESVQASLEIEKNDVLLIPKVNVRVENGKILVDVLKDSEIVTTEIVRGIEGDTTVEVMNGLNVGDKIVIR